jgi:hypothetical protein
MITNQVESFHFFTGNLDILFCEVPVMSPHLKVWFFNSSANGPFAGFVASVLSHSAACLHMLNGF